MASLPFPKQVSRALISNPKIDRSHPISRRKYSNWANSIAKLGFCLWVALQTLGTSKADAQTVESNLSPDRSKNRVSETVRVQAELSLNGNLHLPENALISKKIAIQIPIRSVAKFDYAEQKIAPNDATLGSQQGSLRLYDQASAITTVNQREHQLSLRDGTGPILVLSKENQEMFFANNSVLSREELDLLKLPVSSASLDAFLPPQLAELSEGDSFAVNSTSLATAFRLMNVTSSNVKGKVTSANTETIKMRLEGQLSGNADQTTTNIEMIANLNYSHKHRTCIWLAMGIREEREISVAEPGFEIAATLKIQRTPIDPVDLLASSNLIPIAYDQVSPEKLLIEQRSDYLNFKTLTDRSWYMLTDAPGIATMRQIEDDQVISQCDFRTPPKLPIGKKYTPEDFQNEIVQKLGEQLGSLGDIEVEETPSALQILRVVADGEAQGIPIRWVFLHFGDPTGRRLIATFTMEAGLSEKFSDGDRQIASSLRFLASESAKNQDSSGQTTENAEPR